jgi:hypothetical protein
LLGTFGTFGAFGTLGAFATTKGIDHVVLLLAFTTALLGSGF